MRNPAAAAAAQHLDPHHPHHQGKYVDLQKTQHNFLSFQQQTPRPTSSMAMNQTLNLFPTQIHRSVRERLPYPSCLLFRQQQQ